MCSVQRSALGIPMDTLDRGVVGSGAIRSKRMSLTRLGTLAFVTALLALPTTAGADCDVTDTGIPEDAVASIDPGGMRSRCERGGSVIASMLR